MLGSVTESGSAGARRTATPTGGDRRGLSVRHRSRRTARPMADRALRSVPDDVAGSRPGHRPRLRPHLADDFEVRVIQDDEPIGVVREHDDREGFNVDPLDGTAVYTGRRSRTCPPETGTRSIDSPTTVHRRYPYVRPTCAAHRRRDPVRVRSPTRSSSTSRATPSTTGSPRECVRVGAAPDPSTSFSTSGAARAGQPGIRVVRLSASIGCNGGVEIPLNPIQSGAYARVRSSSASSPTGRTPAVELVRARARARAVGVLQQLPGATLQVAARRRRREPIGGVRFPDVELPLGRAEPVALPPCGASSITDGCGNFSSWRPVAPVNRTVTEPSTTTPNGAPAILDGASPTASSAARPRQHDGTRPPLGRSPGFGGRGSP